MFSGELLRADRRFGPLVPRRRSSELRGGSSNTVLPSVSAVDAPNLWSASRSSAELRHLLRSAPSSVMARRHASGLRTPPAQLPGPPAPSERASFSYTGLCLFRYSLLIILFSFVCHRFYFSLTFELCPEIAFLPCCFVYLLSSPATV